MIHIQSTFHSFMWFLSQATTVGGLGLRFFWPPLIGLIVGLFVTWKISAIERRSLWILFIFPTFWIMTGLLGGYYRLDLSHVPVLKSPQWVQFIAGYSIFAFLLFALITIIYLKGGRWFASIWIVINLYFMIIMTLLASMAVTGDWL